MPKELPDYEVGYEVENNKFYFSLHGREIAAEVDHGPPEKYNGTMRDLTPEDMEFEVAEVTDGNTGEVIKCTEEMRSLIAAMIHDHMSKAHEENE